MPKGIAPRYVLDDIAQFCVRPVYEEFDVAEMSFSWYVAARDRGEPVIALPIFPLRMPVHAYMFCRSDAPYTSPSDLRGKTIGCLGYRFTVNLWLRGIVQDHYGVKPEEMKWVSTLATEGAGFEFVREHFDSRFAVCDPFHGLGGCCDEPQWRCVAPAAGRHDRDQLGRGQGKNLLF